MPTEANIEAARASYEAFAAGDMAHVMDAFSDDIEWVQPGHAPVSGVHRGKAAVIALFATLLQKGLAVRPLAFFGDGERVVVVTNVTLAGEQADEVDLLTFRHGRVAHVQHIGDTMMLQRAFESSGASAER